VSGLVISIIDDDEATRLSLAGLMRALGFAAQTYDSAEAFLSSQGYANSCCIITDIQMAGLSGIELKRELDARNCTVPVIMITARAEDPLRKLALATRPFCLLRKPFKAKESMECVERAVRG
jgi:FixJ family two-component response regulator